MAKEKELNDKEVIEKPESQKGPEITPEVLKETAKVTIQKIDEKNTRDKEIVERLAFEAVKMSGKIEQLAPVEEGIQKKEGEIEGLTKKAKIGIEQETQEPSIEHLPQLFSRLRRS